MNKKRFVLVIKASDIDVSSLPEGRKDTKSKAFNDAVYDYFSKNYGVSRENISINIQNDIITIEWIPEEKDENIDSEFERSMRLLSDGKMEEARFILEDLAFRSPKNPNVLYNLGMCYSDLGDLDIAIDTLNRCVKIVPLYSNAYVALGVAYGRQGKLKEAAMQFRKALELDKNNSYAHRNLASILGKMGDNFNALKYLKLAYDIDAYDPHTLYGLGLTYQNLGDQVNATVYYKKLVELGTPQDLVEIAKDSLRNIAVGAVKEKGGGVLDHLIAHECGHINRMWDVPPEERIVPASTEDNKRLALTQIGEDLIKLAKTIPVEHLGQVSNMWFHGIIRQVTNIPVDMRIEKWIFDNYPELRKSQIISIGRQMREGAQVLSKRVENLTPKKLYDASNYINCSFAIAMESLVGKKYTAPYRSTPYIALGSKLADLVMKSEDRGFKQDIEIINQWTEMLSLKGWYFWVDFEDMPPDYLQYQ